MIKKIVITLFVLLALSAESKANRVYVGKERIVPVEKYEHTPRVNGAINLIKPVTKDASFELITLDEFLKEKKKSDITANLKEEDIIKVVRIDPVISPVNEEASEQVEEATDKVIDEVISAVQEEPEDIVEKVEEKAEITTSEVSITYNADKKTLLSGKSKKSLQELVNKAKGEDKEIAIITYAAGEPSMARRVSLLRANIIQTTLKSLGMSEDKVEIKSFGNQKNVNQARVFIVE
jgi:outer membrane protein OmpA-like peptidoglycan-associated protein